MTRPDDGDYGDRHRCSVCGLLDVLEYRDGHEICLECGAIDGEPFTDEERRHMESLYARISSAEPDPPERFTTETPT